MMPTQALFLTFSFLLRIVEGVGSAMFGTAAYSYLTSRYPEKKGMLVVSDYHNPHLETLIFKLAIFRVIEYITIIVSRCLTVGIIVIRNETKYIHLR